MANSQEHKDRMTERREKQDAWCALLSRQPRKITANVGHSHPDYGLHPKAHVAAKEMRTK